MAAWLTAATAAGLVELTLADPAADLAWVGDVDAAAEYVESKRKDLFAGDPPVFVAGAMIKLGTAMLANRLYARRRAALGGANSAEFGSPEMLRQDPDIAKLLGIGIEGAFVFGAAGYVPPEVVTP